MTGAPQSIGESERAALSQKRGRLAAGIRDSEERKRFIARQGEDEAKGSRGMGMEKISAETALEEGRQTAGVDSSDTTRTLRSMKKGGVVKNTGAHLLHKGERVVPADGEDGKEVHEMRIKKVKSGGYHIVHHFKPSKKDGMAPETDEHVVSGTDELQNHIAEHFGRGDSEALTE